MVASVVLSLMAVTWSLTSASSFLRASSVFRAPAMIQGGNLNKKNSGST
jgi:hypothetical protein